MAGTEDGPEGASRPGTDVTSRGYRLWRVKASPNLFHGEAWFATDPMKFCEISTKMEF